jgi:hypothetical protein
MSLNEVKDPESGERNLVGTARFELATPCTHRHLRKHEMRLLVLQAPGKYPMRPVVLGGAAVYRCGNGLLFSKPLGAEENRCVVLQFVYQQL